MEFLPTVFNNKNNECGYVKWAYAKYKTNSKFKLYTQNGTWKKCCSEKQSILEPTKKTTIDALKIVSSKWIIRWIQYTNYKNNVN